MKEKKPLLYLWSRGKEILNIEPDQETAQRENAAAIWRILFTALLLFLVTGLTEGLLLGKLSYSMRGRLLGVVFFGAFCGINRGDILKHATASLEVLVLILLAGEAFWDYLAGGTQPVFYFLLLFLVLPAAVYDRPYKVLGIILLTFCLAVAINYWVKDPAVHRQNLVYLIFTGLLSAAFSCRTAYVRLHAEKMRKSTQIVAEHDPLTGVYNRGGGTLLIRECIRDHISGIFLIVDIDDFKKVNDTYGHQWGDVILQKVADTLRISFKGSDIVMRMGGDEFIVYAINMVDYAVSCKRIDQLLHEIRKIAVSEEDKVYVSVSIGGAINDGSYPSYDSLYTAADRCLYRTKENGKNSYYLLGVGYKKKEDPFLKSRR